MTHPANRKEEQPPSKIKEWIAIYGLFCIIAICLAAWWDHRRAMVAVRVPDLTLDPSAGEIGASFSDWHWENRYQLRCRVTCQKDAFTEYVVHYICYNKDGAKLGDGYIAYSPIRPGESAEGKLDFGGLEQGQVDKLQLVLVKPDG